MEYGTMALGMHALVVIAAVLYATSLLALVAARGSWRGAAATP